MHQDNALKARPYFLPSNQCLPKLIDNDFGGTIGGPVIRNKLFFFGSYEGDFLVQGNSSFQTVPTAAIRNGDFSATSTTIHDPATGNPSTGRGRTPFLNNIIPSGRISPIVKKLTALVPLPNTNTFGTDTNNYFVLGLHACHQLLIPIQDNVKAGADVLGIPGTNLGSLPATGGLPQFNFTGYAGYGYSYPYLEYNDPVFQYSANVSWTLGRHNLKFGSNVSQQHMNHTETTPTQFTFGGGSTILNGGPTLTNFNSYADFLLGLPTSRSNSMNPTPLTLRTWEYSFYARDQWQITPKLTLTYGTGWEYYPVPTRANGGIERFDFQTNKYLICGVVSTPMDCGISVQKTLFAPRGGIAYRPIPGTVMRAGFALTPEQINMFRDGLYNYPANIGYSDTSANPYTAVAPLAAGIPAVQPPDISSGSITLPTGTTFATSPKNFVRGYVESYNVTVEQDFGKGWLGSIAYVGTHTVHQHTRYNINYGQVGGGAASQPFYKLFGTTAGEVEVLPLEAMNYNSMQLNLGRTFASGFQLKAGYNWSKWIATCCDTRADGSPAIPIPQYFYLNRVASPGDMRSNFTLSGISELPFGRNKPFLQHGIGAAVAGGWQLNGVLTPHTGTPFSISADGTGLNAPGSQQRADQVKPVRILGAHANSYFDPTAFRPLPNTQGRGLEPRTSTISMVPVQRIST